MFSPDLAQALGLTEAIVLQQIFYWLDKSVTEKYGRRWVYNTYEQWQEQFPFWSEQVIARAIRHLEEEKIVLSARFRQSEWKQVKYYSIDIQALNEYAKIAGLNNLIQPDANDRIMVDENASGESSKVSNRGVLIEQENPPEDSNSEEVRHIINPPITTPKDARTRGQREDILYIPNGKAKKSFSFDEEVLQEILDTYPSETYNEEYDDPERDLRLLRHQLKEILGFERKHVPDWPEEWPWPPAPVEQFILHCVQNFSERLWSKRR